MTHQAPIIGLAPLIANAIIISLQDYSSLIFFTLELQNTLWLYFFSYTTFCFLKSIVLHFSLSLSLALFLFRICIANLHCILSLMVLIKLLPRIPHCQGEGWEDGRQGVWDGHVHTTIFKMGNQQGPTETLLNIMWQLGWERSLGENGYMCTYG